MYQQRKCEYCYLLNQLSWEVRKRCIRNHRKETKGDEAGGFGREQLPRDKG